MKRQKIQRELMKLEQENLEKREEIVIKKDETPTKTRATALPKASNKFSQHCLLFKYVFPLECDLKFYLKCRTFFLQVSPEQLSSKDLSLSRKSSGSPKHKSGTKGPGSGKKEKKAAVSSPASETAR